MEERIVKEFEQEMSYLQAVAHEIEDQIAKIEDMMDEEVEEQTETMKWLATKERREVRKFQD